ncbi:MAG: MFS transporter [Zoogloeaceae bacterium]|jgi:AAHS family cis,cis-muconate transporter-like MFS transporter|nr:MFS transporter [Zoogloeaceae bacterium]
MSSAASGGVVTPKNDKLWIIVFIFAFLGLMVDGADLMFLSYSLTSLKREFGLTSVEAGMLGSITLAGMAVGGIFGGWMADRFGRVRTVVWTIFVFSIGTAALGMTNNFWEFATFRFIAALGLGAEYVVCNTLMAEYVPTEKRTTVLGTLQAGWSVGYVLATLLAGWILPIYGWRWLFYIAIIPVGMAVLMQRIVPEPAAWVAARAKAAANKAAGVVTTVKKESAYKLIFGNPGHRRMFALWMLTAGFLQFGYYGVNNWMPSYLEKELHMDFKSMAGYMVGTYVAMILGKIIAGWLADTFGRRVIFALGAIGTAAFLPIIVIYNTPENIVYLLVIFGFLYGVPYGVNATYMTESFETKIRGSAVGGAYNVGRIGAAIAPAAIGYLATEGSIGIGFLVMAGAYFFCGLVPALFIREKLYDPLK